MKKLRVGIWVGDFHNPQDGGAYGYYSRLINELRKYSFLNAEIKFLSDNPDYLTSDWIYVVRWKPIRGLQRLINLASILQYFPLLRKLYIKISEIKKHHHDNLKQELGNQTDVIYYISQMCKYPDFPYIYTLWDIGHMTTYAFPELSMNQIFEWRKEGTDVFAQKALMVFTESNAGKQDAITYLNINKNRIRTVPIFPSELIKDEIKALKPAQVDEDLFFVFYNAQYWAHKNHYNLLVAFSEVLNSYKNLKLILTGSDRGNKKYVFDLAMDLNLADALIDLGFVTNEELKWLYMNAQGLVMPTFLGPSNMPLLEAAELGCRVACSNLPGHHEELGDYAYYFDPEYPDSISKQILLMINEKELGLTRPYYSRFNIENTLKAIDDAFTELRGIRFCWGMNDKIF